jgi:hypothetical protein
MAYVPEWERLSDALKRVMAVGLSKHEAQRDICRAFPDIDVRHPARIVTSTIFDHRWNNEFASGYREIERQLRDGVRRLNLSDVKPRDLLWSESRFKRPFLFEPGWDGYPGPPRRWRVWIELRSVDVTNKLCTGGTAGPNDAGAPAATEPAVFRALARTETAAIRALAGRLKGNPDLVRDDAAAWCREQGFVLTGRGFQSRVWPAARIKAGLAPTASAGRKRKSSR